MKFTMTALNTYRSECMRYVIRLDRPTVQPVTVAIIERDGVHVSAVSDYDKAKALEKAVNWCTRDAYLPETEFAHTPPSGEG